MATIPLLKLPSARSLVDLICRSMSSSLADNLRDLDGWKSSGLALSTSSNECARLLDGTIRQVIAMREFPELGGIAKTIGDLKASDPEAALTNAFMLVMTAMQKSPLFDLDFETEVKRCEDLSANGSIYNAREKLHLKAASQFARGCLPEAESTWEGILKEYPNDLLALKLHHDTCFHSGNERGKRDVVERVLPHWSKSDPCTSYLHGMLAFGLEECGEYEKAEEHAKNALSQQPTDSWATHALAHVYEMQGRTKDSKDFLVNSSEHWKKGLFTSHISWHHSLSFVDDGDFEGALAIYDDDIIRHLKAAPNPLSVADASSLLWRLEMAGVDVGDRWKSMPDLTPLLNHHLTSFNDAHITMALKRGDHPETSKQFKQSLAKFISSGTNSNSRMVAETIGIPLFGALEAYVDGDYEKTVSKMKPLCQELHKIGGSNAQDDVFILTLVSACYRSGSEENKILARQVLQERSAKKVNSGLMARILTEYKQ